MERKFRRSYRHQNINEHGDKLINDRGVHLVLVMLRPNIDRNGWLMEIVYYSKIGHEQLAPLLYLLNQILSPSRKLSLNYL